MDEVWERAVEAALDGQKDLSSARSLTLDGAVKCAHGRLPPPSLLEKFEQLKQLSIANVGVSSLADFPRLPHLQKLILSDNRIAGGLEFLVEAGLGSLRDLDLSNNKIQYIDDLAPLAQLKLVSLDLYECPVTRIVDYRAKVFGMIKSLKYLDKADAEDNERPESDEEEDDDEDEEDDGGSGEIDGEERCGKLDAGPPDEEEDEDEEGDESEEDEEEGTGFLGANIPYPNNTHARSNGFGHGSVFDSLGHEGDEDSSSEDEEDVEDEDDGEAERFLRLAVDASRGFQSATLNGQVNVESSSDDEEIDDDEDEEEEDVENVEVHEVEESEDEDGDEDDEDEEDDDGDEGEEEEDVEEDEDEDNKQPSSGPLPINAAIVPGGEIDDHESDDEDENGELGEEDDYVGDEEVEYDEEDVEEEEEEDNGQEYLVQPVPAPVPAYLPSHVPAPVPVGPAEDEEEASDFEVGLDDEDEDEDDDDDDVEEEDDDDHEQKQILSSKRKRDQDDDTDDSDDEDDEDERPPNKKR
jgi:acidic leucine-rich nuclear phosphoprotein 32 family protein B